MQKTILKKIVLISVGSVEIHASVNLNLSLIARLLTAIDTMKCSMIHLAIKGSKWKLQQ